MIKAIIVDDEPDAIKNLKWELENFCDGIEVSDHFTSPEEAISAINHLRPDCIFLDIEMPEMDGFKLLERLKYRNFDLVITTAFDNYAIQAFKEHAVAYLLKPIDSDDLIAAVEKVRLNKSNNDLGFELKKILESIAPKSDKDKVALPLLGKTIFVKIEDILYCKAEGNYTEVFIRENRKELISKKLKDVEELINSNGFFRTHKSYLANLNCIEELVSNEGPYLILENGVSIPVSRAKKSMLVALLNNRFG
jgi:two-component system LytT family response regulator